MNQTPNSSEDNINPEFLSLEEIKKKVNGKIYTHPIHGDVLEVNVKEGVLRIVLLSPQYRLASSTFELLDGKFNNVSELMAHINYLNK